MMMPIPGEVTALVLILAFVALFLSWLLRGEWLRPRGPGEKGGGFDFWKVVEDTVSHFLLLAMLVSAALQVLVRYLLSDTITMPWTEEFGRLVMVWGALWGAAQLQRTDDHISMSVVFDQLPPRAQLAVRLFGDVVTLAVIVPVAWYGWKAAVALDIMYTIALGLPLSVFAYPIPVAGTLIVLHTVSLMVRRVRGVPIQSSVNTEM